jgi:hypothetical protein
MQPITPLLILLLISLIIVATYPYTFSEHFLENVNNDINLNVRLNNSPIQPRKPRIIVPLYAPWRMYYPYESVYPFPIPWQYQSSPFYPFFDQYNIYQNMIPWNN